MAYKVLAVKLTEIEPTPDINTVKRKLGSFRACYRRETIKIRKLRKTGIVDYSPKWAYFDLFSFLGERTDPLVNEKKDEQKDEETEEIQYLSSILSPPPVSKPKRRPKSKISFSPTARNAFEEFACKQYTQNHNDAVILSAGRSVPYRNLSMEQKLFAKKAIDDVLFVAQLETLHRHSVKINEIVVTDVRFRRKETVNFNMKF